MLTVCKRLIITIIRRSVNEYVIFYSKCRRLARHTVIYKYISPFFFLHRSRCRFPKYVLRTHTVLTARARDSGVFSQPVSVFLFSLFGENETISFFVLPREIGNAVEHVAKSLHEKYLLIWIVDVRGG